MDVVELEKIRTIIKNWLKIVDRNWSKLDELDTYDYYNMLFREVINASNGEVSKYVQPLNFSRVNKRQPLWRTHAVEILSKGKLMLSYIESVIDENQNKGRIQVSQNNKVFVVHGRNNKIKDSMFQFLRAIGVEPIEWVKAKQLTGKVSPFIGEVLDTAFSHAQAIVVLFTPDDEAKLKEELQKDNEPIFEKSLTPQARPNVIFEAGMAFGRCAERTLIIEFGDLRPFSDLGGRHVVRFHDSPENRYEIVQLLKLAGVSVDIEGKTDWLSVGDFRL